MLAALGNYETGSARDPSVLRYEASGAGVVRGEAVGGQEGCRGPLALGDIDGDGRLEMFVGVRVVPGRQVIFSSSGSMQPIPSIQAISHLIP